jgi:hypothetical protein
MGRKRSIQAVDKPVNAPNDPPPPKVKQIVPMASTTDSPIPPASRLGPAAESSNHSTPMKTPAPSTSTPSAPEWKKPRIQNNINNAMPLAAKGKRSPQQLHGFDLQRLKLYETTVRPTAMEHFVGQNDLMGESGILRAFIKNNRLPSMILWYAQP